MEICNIKSIQRVANFTLDDGKMLEVEHKEAIIPGVTMICDLPLLFRNGFPTCLENLTVGQLEKFVPYMIRCSGVSPQTKPKWWPDEILFSTKFVKTSDMSDIKWLSYLKMLVLHCYSYHGCEYALQMCTDSSHKCRMKRASECGYTPMPMYKESRNMPTTRRSSKICCNEEHINGSRSVNKKRNANNGNVRNKSPVQIYLCDNCDSEFKTSREIRAHEKVCIGKTICKSSALPVNVSKINSNRYSLRNKDEPIENNAMFSKIQTLREILPCDNSKTSMTPNSLSRILSRPREPCKNCGKLFISSNLLRDHEAICLKQQLLLARFLSATPNIISPSNIGRKEQFVSQHRLPNTNASEAESNPPLRKKRMNLLPRKPGQNNYNNKSLSQREIFLCDKCDKEFVSFTEIQRHEALGCGVRELSPSPIVPEGKKESNTEDNFLRYFELSPASQSQSKFQSVSTSSRSKRFLGNPMRYSSVPVSSNLGALIYGSQVPTSAILSKREKVERYCPAKPISVFHPTETNNDASEWRVSWKPRKNETPNAVHSYIYPLMRWWKMPKLWDSQMKIKRKNHRLIKLCKSVEIRLWKLTPRDIEIYSLCRTARPILRKLTSEEILLYTNHKESSIHRKRK